MSTNEALRALAACLPADPEHDGPIGVEAGDLREVLAAAGSWDLLRTTFREASALVRDTAEVGSLIRLMTCPVCGGAGRLYDTDEVGEPCTNCQEDGRVEVAAPDTEGAAQP